VEEEVLPEAVEEEEVEAHMPLALEVIVSVPVVVRPFHIKQESHAINESVPIVELLWSDKLNFYKSKIRLNY
jgi:hypothetical protein